MQKKKLLLIIPVFLFGTVVKCQTSFSFSSDLNAQRNIKKDQKFWAIGADLVSIVHFTPRNGAYFSFSYFANGRFVNRLNATAKSPATIPQQVNYNDTSRIRFKQISIGFRKFLVGRNDIEKGGNLYLNAGFGLVLGRVFNSFSISPDTTLYNLPVLSGKANFKRLTVDLGLGYERPLTGDIYIYSEAKVWIPTTDYPSKYLYVNQDAPFLLMLCAGMRILF